MYIQNSLYLSGVKLSLTKLSSLTFKDNSTFPVIDTAKHLINSYSQDLELVSPGNEFRGKCALKWGRQHDLDWRAWYYSRGYLKRSELWWTMWSHHMLKRNCPGSLPLAHDFLGERHSYWNLFLGGTSWRADLPVMGRKFPGDGQRGTEGLQTLKYTTLIWEQMSWRHRRVI